MRHPFLLAVPFVVIALLGAGCAKQAATDQAAAAEAGSARRAVPADGRGEDVRVQVPVGEYKAPAAASAPSKQPAIPDSAAKVPRPY